MNAKTGRTVAEIVARFLVVRGVDRIFGLQGGHIQPIWDHLAQLNVRIVDVRDEGAAVHMAHAHAALGAGLGVALVTAGPGVTNCVTAMANAQLERVPVLLIGGCAPVAQDDLGPLQGIAHVDDAHAEPAQPVPDRLDVAALQPEHAVDAVPDQELDDKLGNGFGAGHRGLPQDLTGASCAGS